MTEQNFIDDDTTMPAAGQEAPIEEEEEEEEFVFPADEGFELPDPNLVVTLRTSGGETRYVPVTGPTPISQIIIASGLTLNGVVQYWLNGAQINADTVVPAGETVTLIGAVKGG